ncbi:hypothetical protein KY284_036149 [Solanum tuberosum]|nr:hypothetical protein KY284_036149 [Solanum tuberosum]
MPYRMLNIKWWTWKTHNPVQALMIKCIPVLTSWEIWKSRCSVKYGKESHNLMRCLSLISSNLAHIVNNQFHNINLEVGWTSICLSLNRYITHKKITIVKWRKPSPFFVKLNTDDNCKQYSCETGGIIRDHNGDLIYAFSKPLGEGTSIWAEASTLIFGIKWCVDNGFTNIMAESDSKMIVDCVNVKNTIPRKISNEVKEIRECIAISNTSVVHCYIESNRVADILAP